MNKNFAKPTSPKEAMPFNKCSNHVVGSSSQMSESRGPPAVAIVVYGSIYMLMIGSATKPNRKTEDMMMSRVRASCAAVLEIQDDHVRRCSLYLYRQVGHSQ